MNFQVVNQANGQSVMLTAVVTEVGASKLNKNGKPYCGCKLMDANGETHSVTIFGGNKGMPDNTSLGKSCLFSLSTYQGKNGIAYSGFFNGISYSQPQAQPQQNKPASYQPAKQPKPEPDWDLKDYRIILQCCSKPFAEAQARGEFTFDLAWIATKSWADNIWKARPGEIDMGEPYPGPTEPDEPYGVSDEIPFG